MPDIKQICAKLIELWDADCDIDVEINALRATLAQPEPEGPTPQPIPVSERLPGPEDCDAEGMCWWYCAPAERWLRCGIPEPDPTSQVHTHWLPAHALPIPCREND